MKKKTLRTIAMITSLVGGIGMVYTRWSDITSLVDDFWLTLFICSFAFLGISGEDVTCGDKNKGRNNLYRVYIAAVLILLIGYILITVFNN